MSRSTRSGGRLLAMLLCLALLLAELAGLVPVRAQAAEAAETAVTFDPSALDGLSYAHGTVSAWLEYDCGNGIMTDGTNRSYLQVAVGTDYATFAAYCATLSDNSGYTSVHAGGIVGGSADPVAYARYKAVDGSHTVYTYILNKLGEVRVIVDTNPDMTGVYADGFVYESTTGETAQPMLVMYGLSMAENGYHIDTTSTHYGTDKVNSGALNVIRMPDNSLFINDGGSNEQWNDAACDRFMVFLRELTGKKEGEKVVINSWFLSHAHTDHFQGFARFVDHYYDQLELQSVMYDIDSERLGTSRDLTEILQMLRSYFPAVKYYKPHTGEHFDIAGIGFDVVYTQEDRFYPTTSGQELVIDHLDGKSEYADHGSVNGTYREECFFETVYSYDSTNEVLVATPTTYDYSDFNDTSTVLKVTFPSEVIGTSGDKTAILYGDVNRVDQVMLKVYDGTSMLKADIMQIPHHGHDAHPELAQISEAQVFLYTQKSSAIYGPNGIADYGVDVGGTYRPALVYNYLAMQEHIEKTKIYWQGDHTVCLTFADAQALPSGMTKDESLSSDTGVCAYTCDTIPFPYEGWSLLTKVSGGEEASATGVAITTSRIRFDQVTSLKNGGRYLIVHDQSDRVLMYDAIARASGQTKPNLATSMEVGSGLAASSGLVDAYYKVNDSTQPDVENKVSIYCTRDKRDKALWILGQDGASGTTLNTATAKFGGTTAYSATTMYKGLTSDDPYWYCVSGDDYVDSSKGDQWRYLRISGSPLFHNAQTVTNWIEFFEDGTCVIYYYESASSIRFLSVTPEGNWVRSKKIKQTQVTGDLLDSLKLRLYEYKTRTGTKAIAYSGPQSYEILKGTDKSDIISDIAATFNVIDSSVRNRPIPCSGTTAKVGYYWLDGTIKASSVSTSTVTLKYRDDDGTDATICTVTLEVLDRLYRDTVISSDRLTVEKGKTETDGKVCKVYRGADGYVTEDTVIDLSMLRDADGNTVTSNDVGEYTGLTLSFDGQVLADDITLTVEGERHSYTAVVTPPTCTEDGYTTYTCTDCGHSYVADPVPALEHDYETVTTPPTCTEGGYTTYTCTRCDDSYVADQVAALGHDYETVTTPPTCTEDGYTTYTCTRCDDSYVADRVPATDHSYTTVETPATCTQAGVAVHTCDHCGHSYETILEKLDHKYSSTVIAPTCTTDGKTVHTCIHCGDSYETDPVAASGHAYTTTTTRPTCTEAGVNEHRCTVCGHTYTETIPAKHSYMPVVTAPTCTAEGYTTYICIVCGDKYTADPVPATGHSYVDGVCTGCGAADPDAVKDPGLTLSYPTLSFEDEIIYNVYFSVADTTSVVEMGLMILPKMDQAATIEDAVGLVPGYVTNGVAYLAKSEGVPAANMGDTLYFKVYAKLTDGTYAYSTAGGYNAKAYANSILSGNNTTEMKALVVSMLNYGAEAQLYFDHNTDKLVNSALTAEQQALVKAYESTMMDAIVKADSTKTGDFVRVNSNFKSLYPSVSFDGAFAINFYCQPAITVDSGMTLYYWDMETMASVEKLSIENATGSMEMTDTNGMYWGQVAGIAAKEMDKTYYVSCVFESNGETITTGIIPYSLGKYCSDKAAADGDAQQAFAQATAVYGYYAKAYFASIA